MSKPHNVLIQNQVHAIIPNKFFDVHGQEHG